MNIIKDAVLNPSTGKIMRTFTRSPQIRFNNNTIYNQNFQVDIPENIQGLSQIYVKNTIACTGDNSDVLPYLGAKLWSLTIRTKSGINILNQLPQYAIARIEELGDPTNNPLVDATNPYDSFNDITTYCITPVFPYFSEVGNDLYNTLRQEPCEILFTSLPTALSGGLTYDLTILNPVVYFKCYEPLVTLPFSPRMDKGYDVFYEIPVTVDVNNSSITMHLTCPFDVYKTDIAVTDSTGASVQIKHVKITQKGITVIDMDRTMLYSLHSKKTIYYQESSSVPIFYTQDQTRDPNNTELQRFTAECYPTDIVVSFESAQANACTLTCDHEYRQYFFINSQGKFSRPLMTVFESNNNF